MSRKKHKVSQKRTISPDLVYNSITIAKLINKIMLDGKKSIAQKILYDAFDLIKENTKKDPFEVFKLALDNVVPLMELKVTRKGGANYQVPYPVKKERGRILAIRWIVNFSRDKKGKDFSERLANEIIDASNNTGASVKRRIEIHKTAEANKSFVHFRW